MAKININLDEANKSRLALKKYDKEYTEVPNNVLPASYKTPLNIIYQALTGESLPLQDCTFLVKADAQGKMVKVYPPAIYRKDDGLVIKWGTNFLPLSITDGSIVANGKYKGKLTTEKVGKYLKPCLTFTVRKDGEVHTMSFPIHLVDFQNPKDSSELELILEESSTAFLEEIGEQHNGERKARSEFVVKASALPLGEYLIVNYIPYENNYGVQHMLHVHPTITMNLNVRKSDEEGNWVDCQVTVEPSQVFSVKANNKLSKLFLAKPIVSEESPLTLRIIGEGEYNGYRTIEFELDDNTLRFESEEDMFLPF